VASGRQLLTLNGQTDHITSVAFSPDGRQVLTASTDQTLWVWNTEEVYR
jgi:WD40 repeat protein